MKDLIQIGKRPRGLREKLVRFSVTLLATVGITVLVVVTSVQYVMSVRDSRALEERIYETMTTRGAGLIRSHAGVFESLARDNALTEMRRTIADAVSHEDVLYGVYVGVDGRPWAYCAPSQPCEKEEDSVAELAFAAAEQVNRELQLREDGGLSKQPERRKLQAFGEPVLEFSYPVTVDGQNHGTLRYGISTKPLTQALEQVRASHRSVLLTGLLIIAGVALGALILGIEVARRTAVKITEPLHELTAASDRLAQGDRRARVKIRSGDELEILGSSFNQMAADLENSYSELEARNEELRLEIEERKLAQAERGELQGHLIQAQKMEAFGQLAGGVAHDFNNILAVVMGNAELVEFQIEDGDFAQVAEINQQISQAAHRGANLTRQLLTFARREAGHPRILNVTKTLREFEKLIRRLLEESVDLRFELSPDVPTVLIDPGRLEQVMMNLCVNARDAMPSGGRLTVKTSCITLEKPLQVRSGILAPGEYVIIETRDTGTGIKPEVLERVFEPFYTTKPAGRGTGLGLATAHGIIRDAGGAIDILSIFGEGSNFLVYLAAQEAVYHDEGPTTSTPLPRGVGSAILLCEDEDSVGTLMTRLLERGGFRVTAVASGAEALEELGHHEFDLLITDAVMPEMDGGALAQLANQKYPSLPVLFVSGYTGGVLESAGIQEDSIYFLRKPFRTRELLERISEVIRGPQRTRAVTDRTE